MEFELVNAVSIQASPQGIIIHDESSNGSGNHEDGHGASARSQGQAIRISYSNQHHQIEPYSSPLQSTTTRTASPAILHSHGIVGILKYSTLAFLMVITDRREVARIHGETIFVVTKVALIPLSTAEEATRALDIAIKKQLQLQQHQQKQKSQNGRISSQDRVHAHATNPATPSRSSQIAQTGPLGPSTYPDGVNRPLDADVDLDLAYESSEEPDSKNPDKTQNLPLPLSIAQDVIQRGGQYGRFAKGWFSNNGWRVERRRSQGMSTSELPESPELRAAKASTSTSTSESRKVPAPVSHAPGVDQLSTDIHENLHLDSQSHDAPYDVAEYHKPSNQASARTIGSATTNHRPPSLLSKLLRTTESLLDSSNFYFSYKIDITRRLGVDMSSVDTASLFRRMDQRYIWNQNLLSPLIRSDFHQFALPLMQGFVGQNTFQLNDSEDKLNPLSESTYADDKRAALSAEPSLPKLTSTISSYQLTLISRRSKKRAGLRYMRRGIDDNGFTANFIETEQILTCPSPSGRHYSFTQVRGSIPLFFTQTPFAFKPTPVLLYSDSKNRAAFCRHFEDIDREYGSAQIVLLIDKSGGERAIGQKYESLAQDRMANGLEPSKSLHFEWFDFHERCKGMRFDQINTLIDDLLPQLTRFGVTIISAQKQVEKRQEGIVRTSCMDCLDRTNVTQAALAQKSLELQLASEGQCRANCIKDPINWFNPLWADNGDAISRQYSSTAALKGDYTRTGQRNYRGALNDLGLTVSRYFSNMVNDYFAQAAIDFLLGNIDVAEFEEFEQKMLSRDPSVSILKSRENAIAVAQSHALIPEKDHLISAWIFLTPEQLNHVKSSPFEEAAFLLTETALICVRLDWSSDSVVSVDRVDFRQIVGIMKGTYITSTLTSTQRDEARNVGMVIKYQIQSPEMGSTLSSEKSDKEGRASTNGLEVLAVKIPPRITPESQSEIATPVVSANSEREVLDDFCGQLSALVAKSIHSSTGQADDDIHSLPVEISDIISLEEARERTGLAKHWSHSLKRLVWG